MYHPRRVPDYTEWDLINFLFVWRLVTTRALLDRFFHMIEPVSGYGRLLDLKKKGYITQYCDKSGIHWAWGLTKEGFKKAKEDQPSMREVGYGYQSFAHDLLVSAFHLGDWLRHPVTRLQPETADLYSEQQLRRFIPEFWPDWTPKSEGHRSDGYWKVDLGDKTSAVALEVELTLKRPTEYSEIGLYYHFLEERKELHRVIWLVRTLCGANSVLKHLEGVYKNGSREYHLFVLLPDFLKLGWAAPIIQGVDTGQTVSQVLNGGKVEATLPKSNCAMLLLDTRKSANVHGISIQTQKNLFAR